MTSNPNPPMPSEIEKSITDFISAQTARIGAQEQQIAALWEQEKALHQEKLSAERNMKDAEHKTKELAQKYSQLRLEAWLDLAKVATVVVAVAFVLWTKFDRLPEVLKALQRADAPSDCAAKPTDARPAATPNTPTQNPAK